MTQGETLILELSNYDLEKKYNTPETLAMKLQQKGFNLSMNYTHEKTSEGVKYRQFRVAGPLKNME